MGIFESSKEWYVKSHLISCRLLRPSTPIVKKEEFNHVIYHKYVGNNQSIFYNYVISHACNFIVEFFPMWLAPNMVTLIGFVVNALPSILVIYLYGYDLSGPIDSWFCYFCGFCYAFYITMDNCDGK
jgi:ethanolaminephosphotransferase